ncbi:hypothetical protein PAPYR_12346 [Paratrimastix pyriformis]|uniref:Uncharacterized protein n=1 Tax=Paratrimastix pyriformis TaxID=342808 RepID=A0ABQ8U7D2_9EUKA|nr:hypothetical protein PAPYR_12346 [Paratrimastix pyriformis]
MWQANLTVVEENPKGDNLEENPNGDNLNVGKGVTDGMEENPNGDNLEGNPEGDNLKKEENPAEGDNLKGHRWATPAGWGMDRKEENPEGDNLKEENPNPSEGDNLIRGGAEENPDFGDNLADGMEDRGDGNALQGGGMGGILLRLRWLGLASFMLTTPSSCGSLPGTESLGGL